MIETLFYDLTRDVVKASEMGGSEIEKDMRVVDVLVRYGVKPGSRYPLVGMRYGFEERADYQRIAEERDAKIEARHKVQQLEVKVRWLVGWAIAATALAGLELVVRL